MSPGDCVDVEVSLYLNPLASSPYYLTLRAEHGLGFERSCAVHLNQRQIITNRQPSHRISIAVFACPDLGERGTFTATLVRDGDALARQELDVLVIHPEPNYAAHTTPDGFCWLTNRIGVTEDDGRSRNGVAHYSRSTLYKGYNPWLQAQGILQLCAVGLVEGVMSRWSDGSTIALTNVMEVEDRSEVWRFSHTCNVSGICKASNIDDYPAFFDPTSHQVNVDSTHEATSETHSITLDPSISGVVRK